MWKQDCLILKPPFLSRVPTEEKELIRSPMKTSANWTRDTQTSGQSVVRVLTAMFRFDD